MGADEYLFMKWIDEFKTDKLDFQAKLKELQNSKKFYKIETITARLKFLAYDFAKNDKERERARKELSLALGINFDHEKPYNYEMEAANQQMDQDKGQGSIDAINKLFMSEAELITDIK